MKLILSHLLLLMLFAAPVVAQNTCGAETASAPVLLNLRLGMTPAGARSVFGKDLKIKNKRSGEYTFFQNFIERRAPDSLARARAIYLRFFDGSLYQIEIFYENSISPATLEDFINLQSAKLNVPIEAWKIEYGIAELNCGDFSLAADKFLNPRLELTDERTLAKVEAKRKKD
jgi:hypothetical protein